MRYEAGERRPDTDYLTAIGEHGVDVSYILTGKRSSPSFTQLGSDERRDVLRGFFGSKFTSLDEEQKQTLIENFGSLGKLQEPEQVRETTPPTDLIYLPEYDVRASAGPGAAVPSEVIVQDVGFQERFLRDLGATPSQCSIIRATGDSMYTTLHDGALLVVDHSQTELNNGCIYIINVAGDLLVKRIRRRIDSSVELISDNHETYPAETIGTERLDELMVVGRVVYFCRVP